MAPTDISPPASASSPWSDLLPDLLGLVLTRLPLPADRARFRAVCRGWHSAARLHVRQLPWMVFPDASVGTIGHGGGFHFPAAIIPGLPEKVTCLGAAAVGWLALDCTDDEFRRTHHWDKFFDNRFLQPRRDVKHRHNYRLYNPFTGETVLLPELDSVIGEVAETFDIRKVLMRHPSSDSPDDQLVAIATNSYNYNIIICRPGKGRCVLSNIDVFDVAFHADRLYGITPQEELVALDLAEDDKGAPIVTKCRRVIKKPLADGEEDHRSWMYDDSSDDDDDNNNDGGLSSSSDDEDEDDDDNNDNDNNYDDNDDGDDDSFHGDDLVPSGENLAKVEDTKRPYDVAITTWRLVHDSSDDEDNDGGLSSFSDDDNDDETSSQNVEEVSFNGDGLVPSGEDMVKVEHKNMPFDINITTRRLVQSSRGGKDNGELLMVRHHTKSSPMMGSYTLDVDILKADIEAGNWVPINELAEDEALFLSRSFSESIRAYGDIKEGCIYYTDMDDVFDTKSRDCSLIKFPARWQGAHDRLLTWLFPPELQL